MLEKCITRMMSDKRKMCLDCANSIMQPFKDAGIKCTNTYEEVYYTNDDDKCVINYIASFIIDDMPMARKVLMQIRDGITLAEVALCNPNAIEIKYKINLTINDVLGYVLEDGMRSVIDYNL